jgi:hypothetical protein
MSFDFGNLIKQYAGAAANSFAGNADQIGNDFHQVAQTAPRETVAQGVTAALRSDQTPPFSQMVGQLFGAGDANQRAGMLNQLISGLNPSVLSSLGGGILGNIFHQQGGNQTISPEQAATLTPEQAQQIAAGAEQQNPGIVDRMGDFYAEHPTLVKSIGGAALAIVLGKMAEGMRQ